MSKNSIKDACLALKKDELVCYPTDTLYGIGADIGNVEAVKKVFRIKNRPFNMPLSVAVSNERSLDEITYVDDRSRKLIDSFLPGPLCLILKKRKVVSDVVTAGLKNVAIRIPDNKKALDLVSSFGPITCTSANIHKKPTPNVISEIKMQFKDGISVYIDDGKLSSKPSTIVDVTAKSLKIVREGVISEDEILEVI